MNSKIPTKFPKLDFESMCKSQIKIDRLSKVLEIRRLDKQTSEVVDSMRRLIRKTSNNKCDENLLKTESKELEYFTQKSTEFEIQRLEHEIASNMVNFEIVNKRNDELIKEIRTKNDFLNQLEKKNVELEIRLSEANSKLDRYFAEAKCLRVDLAKARKELLYTRLRQRKTPFQKGAVAKNPDSLMIPKQENVSSWNNLSFSQMFGSNLTMQIPTNYKKEENELNAFLNSKRS